MECKTCKQKNQKSNNSEKQTKSNSFKMNIIPEEIQNGEYGGNFFFKVIAFFVISIALPLILLVLIGQVFLTFFLLICENCDLDLKETKVRPQTF